MTDLIRAPWTSEQVQALNDFQQRGGMHPFTCGRETHGVHLVLLAHRDGWHCSDPACDYRQDWAHAFMADPAKWPKPWPRTGEGADEPARTTPNNPQASLLGQLTRALEAADGHSCQMQDGVDYRTLASAVLNDIFGAPPDHVDTASWTAVRAIQLMNEAGQQRDEAQAALARVQALADEYVVAIPANLVDTALDQPAHGPAATEATG